jgi:Kef-type K+ transport system membrane component KefB
VAKTDNLDDIWGEVERLRDANTSLRESNTSLREELDRKRETRRQSLSPGEERPERTRRSSSKMSVRSNRSSNSGEEDEFYNLRLDSKESKETLPSSPSSPEAGDMFKSAEGEKNFHWLKRQKTKNYSVEHSALSLSKAFQVVTYILALGGVFFVLIAKSTEWGEDDSSSSSSSSGSSRRLSYEGSHRLLADYELARLLGAGAPKLLEMIAYCLTGAGFITFFVNLLQQPLILGYLLGGVLIGPHCLDIVHSPDEIQLFSSLGLVFLLFMVGLELDVHQLLRMGKVVICTGLLQLPVCFGLHYGIFLGLDAAGVDFGAGDKAVFYVALVCAISSTMIVAKLLADMAEMDSNAGRLTIGILIFQDIWAIIVLAVQPDLDNPEPLKLIKTFAMILLLLVVAMAYAKFVMPVVFLSANKNVELMLVTALCWCFFLCCFAILPNIGLSMELAALVAGVALAAYPYTAELNGKIKYIRDFFITIFFCGLGMQIPPPRPEPILTAMLIAFIVVCVRWIGIFLIVLILGGGTRLAAVATINLSEVSEFALVICSLGMRFEPKHIEEDTLTLMIWVFALLAVMSSNLVPHNYKIYAILVGLSNRLRGKDMADAMQHEMEEFDHEDRNIVLLGFHKIASVLVQILMDDHPHILHRLHVVDFSEKTLARLKDTGITTAFGDIGSPDVLEHAVHTEPHLVLITIPDSRLRGTTNVKMISSCRQLWPHCKIVATSDNPKMTEKLYGIGADYVISMSCLAGDKLSEVLYAFTGTDTAIEDILLDHEGSRPDSRERQTSGEHSTGVARITVNMFHTQAWKDEKAKKDEKDDTDKSVLA